MPWRKLPNVDELAVDCLRMLLAGGLDEVRVPVVNLAVGDPPGILDEVDQRERRHALAGTGLADDSEHLALADVEGDVLDGVDLALLREETRRQVPDPEEVAAHTPPSP
jgi:hypothetical protein